MISFELAKTASYIFYYTHITFINTFQLIFRGRAFPLKEGCDLLFSHVVDQHHLCIMCITVRNYYHAGT